MMTDIATSPLTRSQGDALVALVCSMRRDWDAAGVITAVRQAGAMGGALDVIRAAVEAAGTPTNRTPAIIAMVGPHWSPRPLGHPGRAERCPVEGHSGSILACAECRAGAYRLPTDPPDDLDVDPDVVAAIRQAARTGRVTDFQGA